MSKTYNGPIEFTPYASEDDNRKEKIAGFLDMIGKMKNSVSGVKLVKPGITTSGDLIQSHTIGTVFKSIANNPNVQRGAAGAATLASAAALFETASEGKDLLKRFLIDRPAYEKSFQSALAISPKLSTVPEESLRAQFSVIQQTAPDVAKNPLLAAAYLNQYVNYEGQMAIPSVESMTRLQGVMQQNKMMKTKGINDLGSRITSDFFKKNMM